MTREWGGSPAASNARIEWRTAVSSVLIVDDEAGIREILTRWLSTQGYDIREAPDAETALEEAQKEIQGRLSRVTPYTKGFGYASAGLAVVIVGFWIYQGISQFNSP